MEKNDSRNQKMYFSYAYYELLDWINIYMDDKRWQRYYIFHLRSKGMFDEFRLYENIRDDFFCLFSRKQVGSI